MQTVEDARGYTKVTYRDGVIPKLIADFPGEFNKIQEKTDLVPAGPRSVMLPKKFQMAGQYRRANWDGGDLGRGNGIKTDQGTVTPIGMVVAAEWSTLSDWATRTKALAVESALDDLIADMTTVCHDRLDAEWQGAGDCVLATVESGGGTTDLVLADPFGGSLLQLGQPILFYDAAMTAPRSTTPSIIVAQNRLNDTITIDAAPGGMIDTDVIVAAGVSGADPEGFFGKRYWFNSTASGTQAGLSKVTYPQLITPTVDLGGTITAAHWRLGRNKLMAVRGMNAWNRGAKFEAVMHMAQLQASEALMLEVQNFPRSGYDKAPDSNLNMQNSTVGGGLSHYESDHCDPTLIDIINWSNVFRATTKKIDMYAVDEVERFPIYNATSGGLAAAVICYIGGVFQFGVDDPGAHVLIENLVPPSGYRGA